jgi:hypothetical protein
MTPEETLNHAKQFCEELRKLEARARADTDNRHLAVGLKAQVLDFLRAAAGPKSAFAQQVEDLKPTSDWHQAAQLAAIMQAFVSHLERGLGGAISLERKAQLDVVSDLLEQAYQLLEDKSVHPGAPAVLIGATLEEFLRGWIDSAGLSLGNRKPSLQNYTTVLAEADLITKQDVKDITAWGGLRNHAAHGEWVEVQDPRRIKLMLEGINLFMRKYTNVG